MMKEEWRDIEGYRGERISAGGYKWKYKDG